MDETISAQWDDLFYQFETATAASGQVAQEAYSRYVAGTRAVLESLDIPVDLTPRELVWSLNKVKLYRYLPTRPPGERHRTPLLLVYALINKPFIFDLAPGRSFVEYMVDQGFDIFLLDWGSPGPEDSKTTLDDYVTEYLVRAIRKMRRIAGVETISMLGYCLGALLAVIYAALEPEAPIRNLILLTAPLDFSHQPEGSMAMWLEEERLDLDRLVDSFGNVPGELIRFWAKMLKPMENFVGSYVNLWKMIGNEAAVRSWQAINRWVEDIVPFAGEAFRQMVREYIRENQLVRGEHTINGRPVDLSNIRASLLNIVAQHDHLVAPEQSSGIMDLVSSSDKELKVIPSTHVGIMISRSARHQLWPEVAGWLADRSG